MPLGAPKAVVLPGGEGIPCHNREMEAPGGWGVCTKSGWLSGRVEAGAWPGEQERNSPSSVIVTYLPQMQRGHFCPVSKSWQFPEADWHHVSRSLWQSWP